MKTTIYLILFFLTFSNITYSQPPCKNKRMQKRQEIIKKEKIPFLTNYLDLSVKEAEKFWPIYNEYFDKKNNLLMQKRNIIIKIKQSNNNEEEAKKLNYQYIKILQEECNLTKEYNEKFKKVLPITKVNKIYFAEMEFRRYLIKKMRNYKK